MTGKPIEVDFRQREILTGMLGANHLDYCYQCGACVGDCPSARFHKGFNPRQIMLQALLGYLDELLEPDSIIWQCSNCYNCYQRCPQEVFPVEVIVAIKNLALKKGTAFKEVEIINQRIRKTGRSVPLMPATNRLRQQLNLKPLEKLDTEELAKILGGDKDNKT